MGGLLPEGQGHVPTRLGHAGTVWGGGRGLWNSWHPPGSEACSWSVESRYADLQTAALGEY